ncbi:hypothetical protein [Oryzobacter terrae]|uniref:hypothetical protein n=1 Tax=Oryzobacter terrae TaxID=1620385 RepID=UPI00367156C4
MRAFKVSADEPYTADLVWLQHRDDHPDGPGINEHHVPAAFAGRYDAIHQPIVTGSYISIEDPHGLLALTGCRFTVSCSPRPGRTCTPWSSTVASWFDYFGGRRHEVFTDDELEFVREYAVVQLLLNGVTTAVPIAAEVYRE